jgi:cytochrome c556
MRSGSSTTGSVLTLLILALAMVYACRPQPTQRATEIDASARHAIHSQRLQQIMGNLGTRVTRSWPQEIEPDRRELAREQRDRQFERAGYLARDLGQAAEQIPNAVADVPLSDEERRTFMAHAADLGHRSSLLADAAAARDLDRMDAALEAIETTCNRCHQQFREYAGPIDFKRPRRQ